MCRILLVRSKKEFLPKEILKEFASITQKSKAPDGTYHVDGHGIAWKKGNEWKLHKSLAPIWEEQDYFETIPPTKLLVVHARGAGFGTGNNLDFNEPFIDNNLVFVFNGSIRKISTNLNLEGKIGSQKLFSLLKLYNKKSNLKQSLKKVNDFVLKNAQSVDGMNIGLVDKEDKIYALCQYLDNEDYFGLHYFESEQLSIVTSEPFGYYHWQRIKKGEIKVV